MGHRSVAGKARTFSPVFYLYPLFIDDQFQKETPCPCRYCLQKISPGAQPSSDAHADAVKLQIFVVLTIIWLLKFNFLLFYCK